MSSLLDEALALDEAGRRRWLEALSLKDEDLAPSLRAALLPGRAELADLEQLATMPKFAADDPPPDVPSAASTPVSGKRVGPYELLRRLGAGGMAQVWLAQRADGAYQREVALKLPMLSHLRQDLAQRFAHERDILAGLEHVNIARLYDAGVSPEGLPYLAMEYVPGRPLTVWCDTRQLGILERIKLFLQVLDAVQYAHARQVIHRDIKPSNVLVTDAGQVRLLDFGVAKLLEEGDREQTQLTQVYGRALTPDYASPEYLLGDTAEIASDIYSLGIMLYELLSGSRPYQLKAGGSQEALERAITEAQVPRPSVMVSEQAGAARATSRAKLASRLRGDLDAIVLKTLARYPQQRYGSASTLADDLKQYLGGKPVQALPDRIAYRAGKFMLRNRAGAAVSVAAVLAMVGAALLGQVRVPKPAPEIPTAMTTVAATTGKSIAVLPFADLSEKKDQEYLSDGMAEELLDLLSRVPGLRVIAHSSAFSFKGKNEDARTIAAKLGVANLLEGSVRKSGRTLRITVQLIRATDGTPVWSQAYDRKINDLFKVQDEIAAAVVIGLKLSLLADAMPRTKRTQSTEAHALYLQAESMYWHVSAPADIEHVVDYLHRALKLDPGYAAAWAFLSSMHSALASVQSPPIPNGWEGARLEARRAIELDPNLAEAHSAMAKIAILHDWDWATALAQVNKALELQPENSSAYAWAGMLAESTGDLDKAAAYINKQIATNPLDPNVYMVLGRVLYESGKLEEARKVIVKAMEMNPGIEGGHIEVGYVLLAMGKPNEALAETERERDVDSRIFGRALAYHALGRKSEADVALADFTKKHAADDPYDIAELHAFRGETDQALFWLDRAWDQRQDSCASIMVDPLFRSIAKEPHFKTFLRKMNLQA